MTNVNEPRIEARHLSKRYGDRVVVDRLDLEVAAGEVFGLLGPNGAGKTTTILMLLGLTEPSSGSARVAGLDPARDALAVKGLVGYLPDDVGFYESMTGRQNLRFTTRLNRLPTEEAESRIDAALDEVGLPHAADAAVKTYSRGMRQRLGIADALVKHPEVLILDEPTMAIDPEGVAEIQALIRRLADERGVAVLVSSHLLYQMQAVCDRVGVFVSGRMVMSGSTAELADQVTGTVSYELRVGGAPRDLEQVLDGVPGVTSVASSRDPRLWRVEGDEETGARLATEVVGRGFELRELRRSSPDLDQAYRRYFAEEVTER